VARSKIVAFLRKTTGANAKTIDQFIDEILETE
jgi:hypothetical protein